MMKRILPAACLVVAAHTGLGGDSAARFAARLQPVPPCAPLASAAQAARIPLDKFDPPGGTNAVEPGDSFTGLVTFFEKGGRRTQWLVFLQGSVPDEKSKKAKPAEPLTLYSNLGNKLEFVSSPVPVQLKTWGPFTEPDRKRKPPKPEEMSACFELDQGFLGLGLEQAAAVVCRLQQTHRSGGFWFSGARPTEEQCAEGKALAEAAHLSPTEERSLGEAVPALMSYFSIVQETEALHDILFKIVDMPSLWSLVRHGLTVDIRFETKQFAPATLEGWSVPGGGPVYFFPMSVRLNGQLAMNLTLVVTSPNPPLLACGGVVGFLAEKPGSPETYMTLRIVSATKQGGIEPTH